MESPKKRVTKGLDGTKKRVKKQEGVQAGAGKSDLVTLREETEKAGPDQGQEQMRQQVEGDMMSVEAEIHQSQTHSQSQTESDMGRMMMWKMMWMWRGLGALVVGAEQMRRSGSWDLYWISTRVLRIIMTSLIKSTKMTN